MIAAALAVVLGGCSTDVGSLSIADFNPLKGSDPLRTADYNYFYKRDTGGLGPVTAADLVGPDGRCAFETAPAAPYPAAPPPGAAPPEAAAAPINPRSNQALYFTSARRPTRQPASRRIPTCRPRCAAARAASRSR